MLLHVAAGRQCRVSIDQRPRLAAARSNDAGSWGEGRPDWVETCLDQTGSGMAGDLDAEWQVSSTLTTAVIAGASSNRLCLPRATSLP
jgi:hypothetical protein